MYQMYHCHSFLPLFITIYNTVHPLCRHNGHFTCWFNPLWIALSHVKFIAFPCLDHFYVLHVWICLTCYCLCWRWHWPWDFSEAVFYLCSVVATVWTTAPSPWSDCKVLCKKKKKKKVIFKIAINIMPSLAFLDILIASAWLLSESCMST